MNILKRFSMTAVFALLLVTKSAFADKNADGDECMDVNAVYNGTGDYFEDPEVCDGFDYCIPGTLEGKPSGEMWYFGFNENTMLDPFGTNFPINVGVGEERIYTKRGNIYVISHSLFDFETVVWTELLVVTGGTGKYEGATGRMVLYVDSRKPYTFYGPTYVKGNICTSHTNIGDDDDNDNDDED